MPQYSVKPIYIYDIIPIINRAEGGFFNIKRVETLYEYCIIGYYTVDIKELYKGKGRTNTLYIHV